MADNVEAVQGIQPNVITYTAINTCEKPMDQWQTGLNLPAGTQMQGIQPNVITYTATIS